MKLKLEKALQDYNYLWREIEMLWHEMAVKAGMSDSAFMILYSILELGRMSTKRYLQIKCRQQTDCPFIHQKAGEGRFY